MNTNAQNPQNKGKNKVDGKVVAGGIGAAAGIGAGVVGGVVAGTQMADAAETDGQEVDANAEAPVEEHVATTTVHHHHHHARPQQPREEAREDGAGKDTVRDDNHNGNHDDNHNGNHNGDDQHIIDDGRTEDPEIEVVSYDRVDDGEGGQMDIAEVSIDGEHVLIVDVDTDGYADIMAQDVNHNGVIDMDEMIDVSDQGISMEPFQAAADFHDDPFDGGFDQPDIAANDSDMPDYVNDADVDTFMS